eukprot:jgi/Mesen1/5544/ME000280S04658
MAPHYAEEYVPAGPLMGLAPPPVSAAVTERTPLLPTKAPESISGHGGVVRASSVASAVFNLSTTSIGAGIMALPATVKVLGLPLGLLMILLMGALTDLSIALMLRLSALCGARSYGELASSSFGRGGKRLIEIFTVVHTVGSLIVYIIIMGDVLSGTQGVDGGYHTGVLQEMAGGAAWWNQRTVVLFALTLFVLYPLLSLRHIDKLMFTSALSVLLAVLFVAFTAVAACVKLARGQVSSVRWVPNVSSWDALLQLFTVVPVMTNAFICHYNVHPIYAELADPTEARMRAVSRSSQLLCTCVYLTTALFGYLLFGEATNADVLANFDADLGLSRALDDVVRVGYILHLVLVYPIVFFPLRQALSDLLFPGAAPLAASPARFRALTALTIGAIFLTAIAIPDIYVVFSFLGAAVAVSVGFTIPALLALRCKASPLVGSEKVGVVVMVVLGVVVTLTGVGTNVYTTILWMLR